MAQIQQMQRGKLCVMGQVPGGPFYNHQTWETGKTLPAMSPARRWRRWPKPSPAAGKPQSPQRHARRPTGLHARNSLIRNRYAAEPTAHARDGREPSILCRPSCRWRKSGHDRTAKAPSEHDAPVQSNSSREAVPTFSPVSDITSPEYFFVHSKHACVARLTFLKPSLADAEKDQTSVKSNT